MATGPPMSSLRSLIFLARSRSEPSAQLGRLWARAKTSARGRILRINVPSEVELGLDDQRVVLDRLAADLLAMGIIDLGLQEVAEDVVAEAAREEPGVGRVGDRGVGVQPLEARRDAEALLHDHITYLADSGEGLGVGGEVGGLGGDAARGGFVGEELAQDMEA